MKDMDIQSFIASVVKSNLVCFGIPTDAIEIITLNITKDIMCLLDNTEE